MVPRELQFEERANQSSVVSWESLGKRAHHTLMECTGPECCGFNMPQEGQNLEDPQCEGDKTCPH